jgi:hypothetical protein
MATVRPLCAFLPCTGPHVSADASPRSPRVGNTGAGQRRDGGGLLCRHSLAPAEQVCRVRRVAPSWAGETGTGGRGCAASTITGANAELLPAVRSPTRRRVTASRRHPNKLLRRQAAARLNITQRSISRAIIEFASINTSRMPATSCSVTPASWGCEGLVSKCPSASAGAIVPATPATGSSSRTRMRRR